MLNKQSITIIIPAYNEEKLISKTIGSVPNYVDHIITINDGSHDNTQSILTRIARENRKLHVLKNETNQGVGFAVKKGIRYTRKLKPNYIVIAAGDNQCDLSMIKTFIAECQTDGYDVCRGNRFMNQAQLKNMPFTRKLGNILYSFMTKFVSGYYSLFDFQSSFSAISDDCFRTMDIDNLRDDYLFDNSLWINLNLVNATIKEIPIPVIYDDETSTVNYFKFISSSIPYFIKAYIQRMYSKYILTLSPIGMFYLLGWPLLLFGFLFGLFVAIASLGDRVASTATVMLSVVPFILGIQFLLQAVVLDIQNEPKLRS